MNLSKRNFKLSKRTVFIFRKKSGANQMFISSDPGTSFSITTSNTGVVPKHHI